MVQFLRTRGDAISVITFIVIVLAGLPDKWLGGRLHWPLIVSVLLLLLFSTLVTLVSFATTPENFQRWGAPLAALAALWWLAGQWNLPARVTSPNAASIPISNEVPVPIPIAIAVGTILAVWFIRAFSRTLTPGKVAREAEIIPMVRFCYVFMIFAFLVSLAPLFAILFTKPAFYLDMARSPIGVVKGCVHYPKDIDWELACNEKDPYKAQWLLNIGGSVRFAATLPSPAPTPAPTPSVTGTITAAKSLRVNLRSDSNMNGTVIGSLRRGSAVKILQQKQDWMEVPWQAGTGWVSARFVMLNAAPVADSTRAAVTPSDNGTPRNEIGVIDEWIRAYPFRPTVVVHGGLAVPWYFVTLAILGAAVSLARRVPEYHRRAISAEDSLDAATTREYLEFQILQVLSAPLIAVAAYNLVAPTSISTSAVLGFSSGFSSETVLLAIRGLLDRAVKAEPEKAHEARTDQEIAATIRTEILNDSYLLTKEPDLKVNQIQVAVKDGVVTLSGLLSTAEAVARAEEIAHAVSGVKDVKNEVKGPPSNQTGRESPVTGN